MSTLAMSFSSPAHPTWSETPNMAPLDAFDRPADTEVANKVLRRAQVSKMTRQLQNRLALANVKVKNGWERLSIDSIEPRIEETLRRKRRNSTNEHISDTSSRLSERSYPPSVLSLDSPLGPVFSDDISRSGSNFSGRNTKRLKSTGTKARLGPNVQSRLNGRTKQIQAPSWKSSYRLPESSPAYRHSVHLPPTHIPTLSFVSGTTVADDQDRLSLSSEDDDTDLPLHSFSAAPDFHSSPPRTPPSMARGARLQPSQLGLTVTPGRTNMPAGEEGAADLLMYLAASPSPAHPTPSRNLTRTPGGLAPPSTPPAKHTPLPSSMMNTPGGTSANFLGFGAATPGVNFNFSEFLNVTPSPAQAAWRTPSGAVKTPLAAREARRRINFDAVASTLGPSMASGRPHGLGMELGGELVSSQ